MDSFWNRANWRVEDNVLLTKEVYGCNSVNDSYFLNAILNDSYFLKAILLPFGI